jgi:hypothetical protein
MPFQPPAGGPPPAPPTPFQGATAAPPPPPSGAWGLAGQPQDAWGAGQPAAVVTAGSLMSRTFKVWWANLWKLALVGVLMMLPILIGAGVTGYSAFAERAVTTSPPDPGAVVRMIVVTFAIAIPVLTIGFGAIMFGVFRWLAGQPAGIGAWIGQGFRCFPRLLVAGILLYLAVVAASLLLLVPGLMLGVAACAALPAVAVERTGPIAAFGRSFGLTRGYRWSLFGAFVLAFLVNFGASLVGNIFAAVLPIVGVLVSLAISFTVGTLPWVLPAVAYHDLRVAKEGVDTSALVKVFE